jgi:hypothetical protein
MFGKIEPECRLESGAGLMSSGYSQILNVDEEPKDIEAFGNRVLYGRGREIF